MLAKEELFDLFEKVHTEGGKHLGRDKLFVEIKKQYTGLSKLMQRVPATEVQEIT